MIPVLNAFSFNMIGHPSGFIRHKDITLEEARSLVANGVDSAVGHEDTAQAVSTLLGVSVPCARKSVDMRVGDTALLVQYRGPRLPEGTTVLPIDASLRCMYISVER